MRIYDISVPLGPSLPVWPGDPEVARETVLSHAEDGVEVSRLSLGTHSGTHIDAPAHYLPGGATVDRLDLEILVGPAWVARVGDGSGPIDSADLERCRIPRDVGRLLLRTSNSTLWSEGSGFRRDFRGLAPGAAGWLESRGVRLIGIDYLSIEPFDALGSPVHKALLSAGIVILEGLDLSAVPEGVYTLAALPLLLPGAEAAPARAVLLAE